eukprot:350075-Chlamydomonas_euryale.AAC.4
MDGWMDGWMDGCVSESEREREKTDARITHEGRQRMGWQQVAAARDETGARGRSPPERIGVGDWGAAATDDGGTRCMKMEPSKRIGGLGRVGVSSCQGCNDEVGAQ